jgi:hypothetical protein
MRGNASSPTQTWMSRGLIGLGVACLIFYGVATLNTWRYQRDAKIRPFSFVGNAPQRFIVQGELLGHVAGSVLTGSVLE